MAISLQADSTLPQGYILVDGQRAATVTTAGLSGLVDNSVTSGKILNANITPAKLSQPLTLGTAKTFNWNGSSSNTFIDFENIPSWAKRVTMIFSGIQTNGTSVPIIQLGTSAGIENTGYLGSAGFIQGGGTNTLLFPSGFGFNHSHAATSIYHGHVTIINITSNLWVATLHGSYSNSLTGLLFSAGSKNLSNTLTRVRVTTVAGANAIIAGTVNIMYEG
jgi:hypothetical protein